MVGAQGSVFLGPTCSSMMNVKRKKYRWDRIALVSVVPMAVLLAMPSWGSEAEAPLASGNVLMHPERANEIDPIPALGALPFVLQESPKPVVVSKPEHVAPCSCNKRVLKLPKNPYDLHRTAARNLPNSFFVKNKAELRAGKSRGSLVEVTSGAGYKIARLTHSHSVLLPEAATVLKEMGEAFAAKIKGTSSEGSTLRVSSLTRTEDQQRRLRSRNYNAISGTSTHNYGASFDLAKIDRPDNDASCGPRDIGHSIRLAGLSIPRCHPCDS